MTIQNVLERRINFIEKDKSIYFSQAEKQKFGVRFIYYISIFFLISGLLFSLLSSMNIDPFSQKWIKSGLFYCSTGIFYLKVYGYSKYLTLKKHQYSLRQIMKESSSLEKNLPKSLNKELESELNSKLSMIINTPLIAICILGGISFMWEFNFWIHFDLVVFLILSLYTLFCFHKIQRIKQINLTFINKIKLNTQQL